MKNRYVLLKRVISIILIVMLCAFSPYTSAASAATVFAGTASGSVGEQVTVNVSISNNPGIAYLKLKIAYDSTQLTLKSAQNKALLSGTFTTSKTIDVNPYVLQWMGAQDSTGNGVLATLNFQIAANATAGNKTVSVTVVECYNENFDDVAVSASSGKVAVNTSTQKVLSSISVSSMPAKTTYYIGDSLDTTGLKIKLTYSDGSTEIISSGFTASGFSSTSAGTKTVTVSYGGKTTTFNVNVMTPSITLSATSLLMNVGETATLTASTSPSGRSVTWTSSNTNVASVTSGSVSAKAAGSATVTAKFTYYGTTYSKTCFVTVAQTQSGAVLSVENKSIATGEYFTVAVSLKNNPGLAYLKLKVNYDDSALTLVSAENNGVLSGTFTTSKSINTKPYVIQWMGADNSYDNGAIVQLTFRAKAGTSAGDYTIGISAQEAYNASLDDVTVNADNGIISIVSGQTGTLQYTVSSFAHTNTTLIIKSDKHTYSVSDENGVFVLNNIQQDTYRVYAKRKNTLTVYIDEYSTYSGSVLNNNTIALPLGDVNSDNVIDIADISILLATGNYSHANSELDLTGDNMITVEGISVALMANNYGMSSEQII